MAAKGDKPVELRGGTHIEIEKVTDLKISVYLPANHAWVVLPATDTR